MTVSSSNLSCPTLLDMEVESLLAQAHESSFRDFVILSLALGTGLRNSELIGLKIENIYPYGEVSNFMVIPRAITKSKKNRTVPLNSDLRETMTEFLSWKETHGEDLRPDSFLFVAKFSKNQLSPRDFQRIVSKLSIKAIGRSVHPHILRHTFATNLLKLSNIRVVQKVLGHKNIQTTEIYTHPSTSEIAEAIEKM